VSDPIDQRQKLFIVLSAIFLTALLIANVIAGKYFRLGPLELSVGVIPFPITFILTDVVNEYFGKRGARFLTYVGFAMSLFATGMLWLGGVLPAGEHTYVQQESYDNVFGLSWRLFFGSLIAYLLGQLSDIQTFQIFRRLTKNRLLWLRAAGSTALSQMIDTIVVNFLCLVGSVPLAAIAGIVASAYAYKMAVALALTPLLYVARGIVTRKLGIAPYEDPAEGLPRV
jgi:uncharacterized integral membrane protein (TIGR00697 family)